MTPTEQDKMSDEKLREAIIGIVEAEYKSPNYTPAVERVDHIMQLITADRRRVAFEARIDELKHLTDDDGIWYQDMARQFPQKITLNQRIKELEAWTN